MRTRSTSGRSPDGPHEQTGRDGGDDGAYDKTVEPFAGHVGWALARLEAENEGGIVRDESLVSAAAREAHLSRSTHL